MSGASFANNVLQFGRVLRAAGLDVHHGRLIDAIRALEWIGVRRRTDVRATLRSLLVHRHDDLARFDEAFALFFSAHRTPSPGLPLFSLGERPRIVARPAPGHPIHVELGELENLPTSPTSASRAVGAWSSAAVSRTKNFAELTPAEIARARALLAHLPWELGVRRTRRWQRATGGDVDLRPVLRRNLMQGSDLIDLPRRRRREAARPIVLICDVSGSMERYSRVLMHFVHGLARSGARVESFVFSTRLTRVTPRLAGRGEDRTLARMTLDVADWGGGTRIGEALRTFNVRWARRVLRNGPVVLIVSDGWDRGDPTLLKQELSRLRRSCRRLIWLNPLLGSARYEPLTRGMQAAMPYIDDLLPVHNLASLEQLAIHLRNLPSRTRPIGRRWSAQ